MHTVRYASDVSYEWQKMIVVGALTFFVLSALYNEYVVRQSEYYPFFSWSLFSKIPNPRDDFSIQVHKMYGRTFNTPQSFRELRPVFEHIGQSPTQYTATITELGRAIVQADTEAALAHRTRLERIFGSESFTYDVLAVTFDPLLAYKENHFSTTSVIATFSGN